MKGKRQNQAQGQRAPQAVYDIVATTVANGTDLKRYAWGVYRELMTAFKGLLPDNENHEILEPQGN